MTQPAPAAESYPLAEGVVALPGGFALLLGARALVCADAHLGYEDVMGGGAALPLWSTREITSAIGAAAGRHAVREIVFLGDAIHGAAMSEGAGRAIRAALESLRGLAAVTIVAGNHEGRSRGVAVLGETVESCDRGGWTLLHGDKPEPSRARTMIGHLHPSLRVGAGVTVPAFLAAPSLIVVPALTPYSTGLDVLGGACRDALARWGIGRSALQVVAATADRVFPFGSLAALAGRRGASSTFAGQRRRLRPG